MATKKLPKWATTVTPFSKYLALSMLVVLPVLGFFYGVNYGIQYQKKYDINHPEKIILQLPPKLTPSVSQPTKSDLTCTTNGDCPAGYVCAQAGPIIYGKPRHGACYKKGSMIPL